MLIGIDQEGGTVFRLGSGTALPGNMAVGATKSKNNAKECGQIIGLELSALGINVNFSPILDVNNNPIKKRMKSGNLILLLSSLLRLN